MNDIRGLLSQFGQRGIKFAWDGTTLTTRAPHGSIDAETAALIRANKQQIAAFLSARTERDDILPCDRTRPIPASFPQRRLWFSDRLQGGAAYIVPTTIRIRGHLDRDALQFALDGILGRHEVLRTVLQHQDGELVQQVLPHRPIAIIEDDLRTLTADARADQVLHLRRRSERMPFDLARDLMLRAHLLRMDTQEWLLLLAMHHVATDDWSIDLFLQEFSALYAAANTGDGAAAVLPMLPVHYADVACWQLAQTRTPRWHAQLAYWQHRLAGIPDHHGIALDFPRPAHKSVAAIQAHAGVDAGTLAKLKATARAHGATLFMLLQAALAVVIARWSRERDIVIGTPISGRTHPKLGALIGYFSNTLALRTLVDPEATLSQLLQATRTDCMQAYQHQDVSFDAVIEALRPARDPAYTPVFQIFFSMPKRHVRRFTSAQLDLESLPAEQATCAFDLDVAVSEHGDGLHIDWNADQALFKAATITRMVQAYQAVLQGFAHDPNSRVGAISLLGAADTQCLVEWNGATAPCPDQPLQVLIERQAERTPERIALAFGDQRLSYRSLNRRANALAATLVGLGIGPGATVAVVMPACLEVPLAFLAIMKTGAAFAPLDPQWPTQRLHAALERLAPTLVLHDDQPVPVGGLSALAVHSGNLDERDNPALNIGIDAPLYVMQTSGSTGTPKGAVNIHRGILNRLAYMDRCFGRDQNEVVLQTTHHCYDSAVWQLFWPLTQGGLCVMRDAQDGVDPAHLATLCAQHAVTLTDFTPTLLELFLQYLEMAASPMPRHLRHLIVGGEAMVPALAQACARILPQVRLHNFYGPTETSIGCVHYSLSADLDAPVPIGRPIDNVVVAVVGESLELQPIGAPGELLIGGACLGHGYRGDPAATARAFIALATPLFGQHRYYRSGDLVRWREDGQLEYLGRIDDQIKIRGFRIEPGDIRAALEAHHAVVQAQVLAAGEGRHARLVAYVVATPSHGTPAHSDVLRLHLEGRLPEHMRPAAYVFVDAIPLLNNGKVDRRALAAHRPSPASMPPRKGPLNATERVLADIWASQLGTPANALSMTDNFFEVGGNSLLIVAIQRDIERILGVTLGIADLFSHPTPQQLARFIDDHHLQAASARASRLRHPA